MKIFLLGANENWICDRFVNEWRQMAPVECVDDPESADIIWLVAGWRWNHMLAHGDIMARKPVVLTQHHIVPQKFDEKMFMFRDTFVDCYHVPCDKTREQIGKLTTKQIFVQPFWINQNVWYPIPDSKKMRVKYGCSSDDYLVGSFQRDTEGHDLISPKFEKGPDIFCDIIEKIAKEKANLRVVLAGWRRQYVINRLESAGIPYVYHELLGFEKLNELYNILDLYIVSARYEGGPQAIVECAATGTPIISTDVGLASKFLAPESIFANVDEALSAFPNTNHASSIVQDFNVPKGFVPFLDFFANLLERQ